MNLSSTKNLLIISLLSFSSSAFAVKYSYDLYYDARYGIHTVGAPDVSTHRHTLEYNQKATYSDQWSSLLGARAEVEAAYGANAERYGKTELARNDSQTLLPLENYFQFKQESLRVRLGYQQVVWGEAFGLYYADIVNPKDYRDGGLGDLSRNRLSTPMANIQWIFSNSSIQLLYIPKPFFHRLPGAGSDLSAFPSSSPTAAIKIERDPTRAPTQAEYGARWTSQFAGFDTSLFYLNYFDRMPVYQLTADAGGALTATPDYKPLQSFGATLTYDLSGYLIRSEVIQHQDRVQNAFDGLNFTTAKSPELVYVLGLDLPALNKWQISFQYSESQLKEAPWVFRKSKQSLAAVRIAKEFTKEITLETLYSQYTSDSSQLFQASLGVPVSSRTEFLLGVDRFDGKSDTEFGRYKNASRVWLMIKTNLKE